MNFFRLAQDASLTMHDDEITNMNHCTKQKISYLLLTDTADALQLKEEETTRGERMSLSLV